MTQRNLKAVVFTAIVVCSVAATLVACSSDGAGSDSSASAALTTAADATTTVASTTEAPTTTLAPTTTTVPVVLTLRFNGLGPYDFGAAPDDVIAAVTAQLGAPVRDEISNYPVDSGAGYFRSDDEILTYKFPTGRTVCWSNGFCAAFGAADPAAATFTGWVYQGDPAPTLSTEFGLSIGSLLVDHPEVDHAPVPCYYNSGDDYDGLGWIGEYPQLFVVVHGDGC